MPQPDTPPRDEHPATPHRRRPKVPWRALTWLLLLWAVLAYLIVPRLWELYFRHHKDFAQVDRLTQTSDGHPGDPINIALIGTDALVVRAMSRAGWYPADPITLATSLRIAADSVLHRPDDRAPVSNLYLFGRKQDLAFEQPVPGGPEHRHHVRFWRWDRLDQGRVVWFGSATFDERVGLSYTTGQVTHHIGPDIDAERDRIVHELQAIGQAQSVEWDWGFHSQRQGHNGGGDAWHTDGRLAIVVLVGAAGSVGEPTR